MTAGCRDCELWADAFGDDKPCVKCRIAEEARASTVRAAALAAEEIAWYRAHGHCGHCGEPGVFCSCTETDPCGCRGLHEMGSALLPGAVAAFSDAPVVEQPDLFGDA